MFWIPLVAMAVTAAATAYSGSQQAAAAKKNAAAANASQAAMQEDAQSQQWELQQESQRFQQEQDQIARAWQERMSNTAYQRSRQDLLEAGLNPILAAGTGGASSPPVSGVGAGAPGSPMGSAHQAQAVPILGPAVAAAMQAAQTIQGLEQVQQQISQSEAQTALLEAQQRQTDVNTGLQVRQTMTEEQREVLTRNMQQTELERQAELRARAGLASEQARTEPVRRDLVGQQAFTEREETGRRSAERQQAEMETRRFENYGPRGPVPNVAASAEAMARRFGAEARPNGQMGSPVDAIIESILRIMEQRR